MYQEIWRRGLVGWAAARWDVLVVVVVVMVVMVVVVVVVAVVVVDDVVKAEEDWIRNGSATVAMITSMLSMFQIGGGGVV